MYFLKEKTHTIPFQLSKGKRDREREREIKRKEKVQGGYSFVMFIAKRNTYDYFRSCVKVMMILKPKALFLKYFKKYIIYIPCGLWILEVPIVQN